MSNVTVKIDDVGNIFIIAPQYDVSIKKSYRALIPDEYPSYKKKKQMRPLSADTINSKFSKTLSKIENSNQGDQSHLQNNVSQKSNE